MDSGRFDALARALVDRGSRRRLVGRAAAGALASLGLIGTRPLAASQESSVAGVSFPVQPICTCPAGLVLCQGLCVQPENCDLARSDAQAATSQSVGATPPANSSTQQECPPQEQYCASRGICVSCPASMRLGRNCDCLCRENQVSECSASCDCPRVAVCSCVCPGPPCQTPKVQNANTCECVCPNDCPGSLVHEPTTCNCVCPSGTQRCGDRCIACPPGGTLNPDFCDCVCETILAPSNGTTVSSKLVLLKGQQYTIRVSGKFDIGGGRYADADHVFDPNDNLQLNKCGAYGGDIGLTIDDPTRSRPTKTPQSWGSYTKSHVYTTTYTGTGKPISFTYNDCNFSDNRGTLTVEILCPCAQTVCDHPRVPNVETCECVCPNTCPAGSTMNETCQCVCDFAVCDERCCTRGEVCNATVDPPECCTPSDSCPDGSCGAVSDGCGGTIDRGLCPEQTCQIGVCNANGACNGCAYVRSPDNAPGPLCTTRGSVCCGGACCAASETCVNGACCTPGGTCPAGFCGSVPDGCGGQIPCSCSAGRDCCGTSCKDTATDARNCGKCGHACPRALVCKDGGCVCPAGRTLCGGRCVACPAPGTVNPNFCDCVCDTIVVPTNGTTVTSAMTLVQGQQYSLRVTGKFTIGGGRFADADYVFDPNDNLQTNSCGLLGGDIGITIDDPGLSKGTKTPKSWGPYRKDHVYSTNFTGSGKPISFTYNDCNYADNRGTLTVEILCPTGRDGGPVDENPVGVTPEIEPTSTPTPVATGTPLPVATSTPVGTGGTGPLVEPTPTSTAVPEPTATIPTGPPTCGADELLCVDRCISAAECPAQNCCFDSATCSCNCPDCAGNFVFDSSSCSCVCTLNECPPNYLFDETGCTCMCQPVACPTNFVFDASSCSCVCLPPACPPNYQFDPASCSCFCAEVGCPEGEVFDPASCACLAAEGAAGEVAATA